MNRSVKAKEHGRLLPKHVLAGSAVWSLLPLPEVFVPCHNSETYPWSHLAITCFQAEEEAGVQYERKWDAVWIRAQDIISEGILISPRMTSDHYTTTLIGALQARCIWSSLATLRPCTLSCSFYARTSYASKC